MPYGASLEDVHRVLPLWNSLLSSTLHLWTIAAALSSDSQLYLLDSECLLGSAWVIPVSRSQELFSGSKLGNSKTHLICFLFLRAVSFTAWPQLLILEWGLLITGFTLIICWAISLGLLEAAYLGLFSWARWLFPKNNLLIHYLEGTSLASNVPEGWGAHKLVCKYSLYLLIFTIPFISPSVTGHHRWEHFCSFPETTLLAFWAQDQSHMTAQNKNRDLISGIWQPKWPTQFLTSWYTCPCLIPFQKAPGLTWVTSKIWMAEEMVWLLESRSHTQRPSFTLVSGPFTLHGKPGFLLWVSSCRPPP